MSVDEKNVGKKTGNYFGMMDITESRKNGNNPYFAYYDGVANAINNLPMDTNKLNDYDNVTYHCDLFVYGRNTQTKIDEKLSQEGFYEPNREKRCYICKDGVTTKFFIDSFIMKSKYGNHQNPINVATYTIELTIKETFSCILSHELDVLGILSGYENYLQRPYWLEIWFSGYDKLTGMPVERIPLPNGEKSIIYEGMFSKMISHIDSHGTTWKATFFPIYTALTQKNMNILNVSSVMKNFKQMNLKEFLKKCTDDMFERFLKQVTKDKDEKGRRKIRSFYNSSSIDDKDKKNNPSTPIGKNQDNQEITTNKEKAQENFDKDQSNNFITFKIKNEKGEDFKDVDNIKSNLDSSTKDSEKNSEKQNTDETILFTTICQEFLFNTEKYNSYIAKYDIRSSLKGYYNGVPLYHHDVDIYLVEDPYMTAKLKAYNSNKENYIFSEDEAVNYVNKFIAEGVLIKKYQYGFSGEDTSVIEIDNKYDKLFFMNALPEAAEQWSNNNIIFQNEKIDENEIITTSGDDGRSAGTEFNGENLEDIYIRMDKKNIAEGVIKYNKTPELNDDLSNDNRRISTGTDIKKSEKTIAATILWKNLYKSDQMVTSVFTILGDPYWLATNSFRTKQYSKSKDLLDKLPDIAPNIPDYRCIFIIKSSPEQNQFYDLNNPTDYTFENSLYVSGIYIVTDVESIFESGKFTQKIKGHLDIRFIKE